MKNTDAWGRVVFEPDSAFELALRGADVWGLSIRPDEAIEQYNRLCDRFDKGEFVISPPEPHTNMPDEEHESRSSTWLVADDIREIAVRDFLLTLCRTQDQRDRVNHEMDLYEERNLIPLLQSMMYLVHYMRENGIVWGVGRGSSVASYCLYLIGIHRIDSIRYGLVIEDFLKE